MLGFLTKRLIGCCLANREAEGRKIGVFTGVPAMGMDGLAPSAYDRKPSWRS